MPYLCALYTDTVQKDMKTSVLTTSTSVQQSHDFASVIPTLKGWSKITIYRMVKFYETYETNWARRNCFNAIDANPEVVRYALNRSMSPTMVSKYEEQIKLGSVLQRSLEEFVNFLDR